MLSTTPITPDPSSYYSTNLNNRINDIDALSDRIAMSLGYPQINVEAHTMQVYDNIAQACEMFTKFAGYTEEYLIFHSSLYEESKGLYMPTLINHTPELEGDVTNEDVVFDLEPVTTSSINEINVETTVHEMIVDKDNNNPVEFTVQFKGGYYHHVSKFLITAVYNDITDSMTASTAEYGTTYTAESPKIIFTIHTVDDVVEMRANSSITGRVTVTQNAYSPPSTKKKVTTHSRGFDDMMNSSRKVVDLFSFEQGTTSGINTLFTIEQTMAQQTYFSYSMGSHGFDLVSWYALKEWLGTRNKMLSTAYHWRFNDREQRMYMTPSPTSRNRAQFWGLVGAWIEKPIKDVMRELWVYQYSLALTKITIARIRGKYQGTNLFGGGTPNYAELLSEGQQEKQALEARMFEGSSPGFGDADPPQFFVG